MEAIVTHQLHKSFGGVKALDHVTFAVPSGTTTAVIGPNGAGKTTLLNVLTGLETRFRGSATVLGHSVSKAGLSRLACMGVARTFQDVRLIRQVSIRENLIFAQTPSKYEHCYQAFGLRRPEVLSGMTERLLEAFDLAKHSEHEAGKLSYGQQKLLTLVCALARQPQVLFLDEPLAGVNPVMREVAVKELRAWAAEGGTVMFVEHDLEAVRALSDTVMVMSEGRLIYCGSPDGLGDSREVAVAYLGGR